MFNFFKKKKTKINSLTSNETNENRENNRKDDILLNEQVGQFSYLPVKENQTGQKQNNNDNQTEDTSFGDKNKKRKSKNVEVRDGIKKYSLLTGEKEKDVENLCNTLLLKKFFAKIGKVLVRFEISDAELEKIIINCKTLNLKQLLIEPAYIGAYNRNKAKIKRKTEELTDVGVIVDFPFGGSTYKSKIIAIKDSVKNKVDDISVMMPSILLSEGSRRDFKYQIKKTGKIRRGGGIALNGSDLTEKQISSAVTLVEKTKLGHITFVFGQMNLEELYAKMHIIKKCKKTKEIRIICNADNAVIVSKLLSLGADAIFTPFAEKVCKELVEDFGVEGLKIL